MLFPNGGTSAPPVSSPFGPRPNVGAFSFHYGADCVGYSTVRAAGAGRVTFAGWMNPAAGNTVLIDLGGGVTEVHMHLASFEVSRGRNVSPGTPLGRMGRSGNATGNCDHFEIRVNGRSVDPIAYTAARLAPPASTAALISTEKEENIMASDIWNVVEKIGDPPSSGRIYFGADSGEVYELEGYPRELVSIAYFDARPTGPNGAIPDLIPTFARAELPKIRALHRDRKTK